jgi:uncharacterized C2H2 Zn-finger protein
MENESLECRYAELQLLSYLFKKRLRLDHDTSDVPELKAASLCYRPDFIVRYDSISAVIEVDENGHSDYDVAAEVNRMLDIWKAFGNSSFFIRVCVPRGKSFPAGHVKRIFQVLDQYRNSILVPSEVPVIIWMFYSNDLLHRFSEYTGTIKMVILDEVCDIDPEFFLNVDSGEVACPVLDNNTDCPRCGIKFSRSSHLQRHLQRVTPCEPLLANIAPESALRRIKEAGTKIYKCPNCTRSYNYVSNLRRHIRAEHVIITDVVLKNIPLKPKSSHNK